jgi:hypothetical protein
MGKYINTINGISIGSSFDQKCKALIDNGAISITDSIFLENMICVVDNGWFGAAAYTYSTSEYEDFKFHDGRPKQWFTLENVFDYID